MLLLSPRSFNLYFCFGSLNLQIALAFWYGPVPYIKDKLFGEGKSMIASIYVGSLLMCLYLSMSGAGYLMSLGMIALQGFALAYFVVQALSGPEAANSWAYALVIGKMFSRN